MGVVRLLGSPFIDLLPTQTLKRSTVFRKQAIHRNQKHPFFFVSTLFKAPPMSFQLSEIGSRLHLALNGDSKSFVPAGDQNVGDAFHPSSFAILQLVANLFTDQKGPKTPQTTEAG